MDSSIQSGWTHVVINYFGSSSNDKIVAMYFDGEKVIDTDHKNEATYSAGDGRIVVGRRQPDKDKRYTSVQVDELVSFNRALTSSEVMALYSNQN